MAVPLNYQSILGIYTALQNEAAKKPADGNTVKEIAITDAANNNAPITPAQLFSAFLPKAQEDGLMEAFTAAFEPSLGAYFFYDDKGAWPGYILTMKQSGIDTITLTERLQKIEGESYANFFLSPPGTASAFKTGQVAEKYINRFASFPQAGASFSYGLYGNYLIISTSQGGLMKALELLKL